MVTARAAELRSVSLRKRATLIAVCGKCADDGATLRKALNAAFKRRGVGKEVRVVKSSCLDICPKRAIALAVAGGAADTSGVRYFIVERHADPEVVATQLRQ